MASATTSATRNARTPRNLPQRDAAFDRLSHRLEVKGGVVASMAIALLLHVGIGGSAIGIVMLSELWKWHHGLLGRLQVKILDEYQIDVVKEEEPPPPPPEPAPEPPKEEVKPDTPPPPAADKPVEPAPPAAAQAGKVIAADPTPDEPLDMTNSIIQGTGDTYAGGVTSSTGTGKTAVRNPAASASGVPGGTGTVPGATGGGADRSRAAGVSGSSDWDCPFPPEADSLQEDLAYVSIRVMVGADGRAQKVTIVKDPGHGFAREARTCAMQKKFLTALDAAGNAVPGETKEIRVRFER